MTLAAINNAPTHWNGKIISPKSANASSIVMTGWMEVIIEVWGAPIFCMALLIANIGNAVESAARASKLPHVSMFGGICKPKNGINNSNVISVPVNT